MTKLEMFADRIHKKTLEFESASPLLRNSNKECDLSIFSH